MVRYIMGIKVLGLGDGGDLEDLQKRVHIMQSVLQFATTAT